MPSPLTRIALGAFCLPALVAWAASAQAQDFPTKPITIVAPFAAGASADGIARVLARELGQVLGQAVVVDNRPGAGGATGLLLVAKAPPDGYTIGMGATGAIAIGPHLPDAPPLDPERQLQPLAKVADIPLVLITSPKSGFDNLQALLARAKAGEVPVANAGQYTAHHLASELLASAAKAQIRAVPYRGSAPAVTDVIGDQVPAAIVDLTSAAPHLKAGSIKGLAVTSARRSKLAPDIPAMAEAGVPGYAASAWMGMFAPKGVSPAVRDKLSSAIQAVLDKPGVQAQILALSAEPEYRGPQPFARFIAQESQRWAGAVAALPRQ